MCGKNLAGSATPEMVPAIGAEEVGIVSLRGGFGHANGDQTALHISCDQPFSGELRKSGASRGNGVQNV